MTADTLLDRLDGVRRTGAGRWLAKCPAHADRSPSLSLRELDDGRVLVHCFSQCSVEDVLGAVGLDFDALFPPRAPGDHLPRERVAFPAPDVLRALADEAVLVAVAAANIARRVELSDADRARVVLAAERIGRALDLAGAR